MNRTDLAAQLYKTAYLTGNFKLRSGQSSHEYFDKYRFESQPKLLKAIAEKLVHMIPPGTEVLAGLEMGGIPIATALSLETGLPVAFIRKSAKNYGTCLFAEGLEVKGKKLCIIEDVVTTGGQVLLSSKDLRSIGALVEHVICVIHRGNSVPATFADIGLSLTSLFGMEELKEAAK